MFSLNKTKKVTYLFSKKIVYMQTDEGKRKKKKEKKVRACLANKKWSLNFHHSSLITHHSIFHIRLPLSLTIFHTI